MTPVRVRVLQPIWVTAENRTIMPQSEPIEVDWPVQVLEAVAAAGGIEILPAEPKSGKKSPPPTEAAKE